MDMDYYKKIFSKNLRHYMNINGKSQIDIINDLNINKSSISTWCNGTRLPRMDKVDMLAKYFHINRSDLIEDIPTMQAPSQSRIQGDEIMSEKELNNIIAKNISRQLELHNKTQLELAEYMNVSQASVSNWCKGTKMPRMSKIDMICDYFSIMRSDLMEDKSQDTGTQIKGVKIPVLGSVPAGIPIDAIRDIIDYEEIPDTLAALGSYFGLKIKGHSMEPQISDKDIVIVKQVTDVDSGAIAIVMVNGDEATCKKVVKQENGISLVSFNPAYDPMFFSNKEIEEKPVQVIGKVVELRRKFQ